MAIDRVTLEILRNYYQAIVEDMARIMERTAYTTFVKETADFSTGLVVHRRRVRGLSLEARAPRPTSGST